jgi:hypothetical protein
LEDVIPERMPRLGWLVASRLSVSFLPYLLLFDYSEIRVWHTCRATQTGQNEENPVIAASFTGI